MAGKRPKHEYRWGIGAIVYLKTDPDKLPRIVSGYMVRSTGVLYMVSLADHETQHYDFELSGNPRTGRPPGFARNEETDEQAE